MNRTDARSVDSLASDLTRLGVQAGDTVMVHASLRRIGPVDGGAHGVIHALDQAVGNSGTVLMVLGAADPWSWVNDLPEHEREAALADATAFDAASDPADPDVGVLAEVFRITVGTVVSDHPEGRFGARGARAAELVENPPWDDYYGPGSALDRLLRMGGKVLRLGADLDTVTLLHHAEYLADVAHKRRVVRHRRVASTDGPIIRTISCLDDSNGIVDRPGEEDYFITLTRSAIAADLARTGQVGNATSELFDAAPLVRFAVEWMNEHLN